MTKNDHEKSVAEEETISVKTPPVAEKKPISDAKPTINIAQTQPRKQAKKKKVHSIIRPASLPQYVRRKNRGKLIQNENKIETGSSERHRRQAVAATREDDKEDYQLALAGPTICPRPPESQGSSYCDNISTNDEEEQEEFRDFNENDNERPPNVAILVPDDPTVYETESHSELWLERNKWKVIIGSGLLLLAFIVAIVILVGLMNAHKKFNYITFSPTETPSVVPSTLPTSNPSTVPSKSLLPTTMPTAGPVELFGRRFDRATTRIYILAEGLTGSIPSTIGSLTALTLLTLFDNALTGTIPTELGSLTALTYLDLGLNELTGTIPTQLGSLTQLSSLKLWSNALTGTIPTQLGSLTQLTRLDLDVNQLTGKIPTELELLTKLESLYLYRNDALYGSFTTSFCTKDPTPTVWIESGQNITCDCCRIY